MSSRRTLYLMFILVVAAAIGRFWVHEAYASRSEARAAAMRQYRTLWETVDDLQVRLRGTTAAKTESETLVHFQQQALKAQLGTVNTTSRERSKAGYSDRVFTVEFEAETPRFTRQALVYFLYYAETLIPRMRLTRLAVRPAGGDARRRQLTPGSEREDLWRVDDLQFTQRSPVQTTRDR